MIRMIRHGLFLVMVAPGFLYGSTVTHAQGTCAGDIDGDDQVTISELVSAVNSALNGCGDRVTCHVDDDCDPDEMCIDGRCV